MNYSYTIWIVLVPLVIFLVTGLFGGRFKPLVTGIIGTTGLFCQFLLHGNISSP
jgi:NADH-quinone oxidoreductase subunit L